MAYTNYSNNVPNNPSIVDFGKAIQLVGDTRFPDISVTRIHPPDNSNAFYHTNAVALTSIQIYPKHALLSYIVNTNDLTSTPIASGTNTIGAIIGQRPFNASVTITRPSNTTVYSVGQVINSATSGLTVFPSIPTNLPSGTIVSVNQIRLISSNGSTSTKLQPSLVLHSTASPSGGGFNDASTYNPSTLDTGSAAFETFPQTVPTGSACYILKGDEFSRQATVDASGNLYCALVAQNAYTPASGETIKIEIFGNY